MIPNAWMHVYTCSIFSCTYYAVAKCMHRSIDLEASPGSTATQILLEADVFGFSWLRGYSKSWLNRGGRLCPPRLTDLPWRARYTARRGKLFYRGGHLLWPAAVMFISRGGLYYLPASVNYFLN